MAELLFILSALLIFLYAHTRYVMTAIDLEIDSIKQLMASRSLNLKTKLAALDKKISSPKSSPELPPNS